MTPRGLIVLLVLMLASPLAAQSRGTRAKADPISGTWTGEIVLSGADRGRPVTLDLKYDGKRNVAGTATGFPNPADVKTGTFDPKTAALKLQLGKVGDSAVLLVFDGTVTRNTASGRVSGDASGQFTLTKSNKPK